MATTIWLRLRLPDDLKANLVQQFPNVDFVEGQELGDGQLEKVEALFTNQPYDDTFAKRLTALRWVHTTYGAGNVFLTPSVKERPIAVSTSTGVHGDVGSEFGLAMILAMAKQLRTTWDLQQKREWNPNLSPVMIEGKTLGIIGMGTIGTELARKANLLGMRVIATKRTAGGQKPAFVDDLQTSEGNDALLSQSDFVVLLVPSVGLTHHMIGEPQLRAMKSSAYLINLTGRVAVDLDALAKALNEDWIAGAALDTYQPTPLPAGHPLWDAPNLLITPRIVGAGAMKWNAILEIFADNVERFVNGKPLRNAIDKEIGY